MRGQVPRGRGCRPQGPGMPRPRSGHLPRRLVLRHRPLHRWQLHRLLRPGLARVRGHRLAPLPRLWRCLRTLHRFQQEARRYLLHDRHDGGGYVLPGLSRRWQVGQEPQAQDYRRRYDRRCEFPTWIGRGERHVADQRRRYGPDEPVVSLGGGPARRQKANDAPNGWKARHAPHAAMDASRTVRNLDVRCPILYIHTEEYGSIQSNRIDQGEKRGGCDHCMGTLIML
mmetsp:Transcript_27385/g.78937  ORF Transcript_27385/g.78937 Transcript_27385/m.78937 type:complete len:227 (-) Transcript_27385:99-779(-)